MREKDLQNYYKNDTWKNFHAYIDALSQKIFSEYPGDRLQAISIFQPQCAKMTFIYKSIHNRLFQHLIYKGGEAATNYIKRFENDKALVIPVGNSYYFLRKFPEMWKIFCSDSKPSSKIDERRIYFDKKSFSISTLQIYGLNLDN